jgi:hypothetical protein
MHARTDEPLDSVLPRHRWVATDVPFCSLPARNPPLYSQIPDSTRDQPVTIRHSLLAIDSFTTIQPPRRPRHNPTALELETAHHHGPARQ